LKLKEPITLEKASQILNCEFIGAPDQEITGLNEIHVVDFGDLVFVDHPKYYDKALHSKATFILIDKKVDCPLGKGLLISDTPFDDFNKLTKMFAPFSKWDKNIGNDPIIGTNTLIHPNAVIGRNVIIGDNCEIHSGVVLNDHTILQNNVTIQANTVIGGTAFYYKKKDTGYDRWHTCGYVKIEDHVEIGALCTIDAGVTGCTLIGEGSKLDNQIQVGHDTQIGKNCLIAAQVGISGCVTIGNDVTLWGQVGIVSDVSIGDGAVLLGMAGVSKNLAGGKTYFGQPCGEVRVKFRELAAIRSLPKIIENL